MSTLNWGYDTPQYPCSSRSFLASATHWFCSSKRFNFSSSFFAFRISWRSASFKWLPSGPLLPAGCKFCIISSAPARLCCLLEGFDDREEPAWAIHIWEVPSASVTLAKANVVKPSLFFRQIIRQFINTSCKILIIFSIWIGYTC